MVDEETAEAAEMRLGVLGLGLSLIWRSQGLPLSGVGMAVALCGAVGPLGSSGMP